MRPLPKSQESAPFSLTRVIEVHGGDYFDGHNILPGLSRSLSDREGPHDVAVGVTEGSGSGGGRSVGRGVTPGTRLHAYLFHLGVDEAR